MQNLPSADELREQLAALNVRQQKIVAGVLGVMIQHPGRMREREWISEQFTQVALLAGGLSESADAQSELEELQEFIRDNIHLLLNLSFALFAQVAGDLEGRGELHPEAALAQGMSYF